MHRHPPRAGARSPGGRVIDAVRARIADKVRVGDPAAAGVTMGALVGLAQRDEVRKNLAELAAAAELVIGDPDHFDVIGADPERGAFLPPVLLWAKDSSRNEPHDIEVFGPVSTVLGYRDTEHAIELAARGRGSLVGLGGLGRPAGGPGAGPRRRAVAWPGAGAGPGFGCRIHRPRLAAAASGARWSRPGR